MIVITVDQKVYRVGPFFDLTLVRSYTQSLRDFCKNVKTEVPKIFEELITGEVESVVLEKWSLSEDHYISKNTWKTIYQKTIVSS